MQFKPSVYLAGPITGCSYGQAVHWREVFRDMAGPEIECWSPMRAKDYLSAESVIHHDYPEHVLSCQRGIMTRDYFDCRRADAVVAYLHGAQQVSVGTVCEMAWCFSNRTPLIAVMESTGNPHDHPMLRECIGFRVTTIEEAAHVARTVLLARPEAT